MKWYVYFLKNGIRVCHCFEDNEEEARHFANLVNGEVVKAY